MLTILGNAARRFWDFGSKVLWLIGGVIALIFLSIFLLIILIICFFLLLFGKKDLIDPLLDALFPDYEEARPGTN